MEFVEGMTVCVSGMLHFWFADAAANSIAAAFPGRPDLVEAAKKLQETKGVPLDHQNLYVEAANEHDIVFRHPGIEGVFLTSPSLVKEYFRTIHSVSYANDIQEDDLLSVLGA